MIASFELSLKGGTRCVIDLDPDHMCQMYSLASYRASQMPSQTMYIFVTYGVWSTKYIVMQDKFIVIYQIHDICIKSAS